MANCHWSQKKAFDVQTTLLPFSLQQSFGKKQKFNYVINSSGLHLLDDNKDGQNCKNTKHTSTNK